VRQNACLTICLSCCETRSFAKTSSEETERQAKRTPGSFHNEACGFDVQAISPPTLANVSISCQAHAAPHTQASSGASPLSSSSCLMHAALSERNMFAPPAATRIQRSTYTISQHVSCAHLPSLLLRCAVPCCAVLCRAVPCRAVLCCAVLCCADLNPPAMEPYCRDGGTPSHPVNSGEFKRLPGWDHQLTMCNTECERAHTHTSARAHAAPRLVLSRSLLLFPGQNVRSTPKQARVSQIRFQRHVEPEWF
jgi:hypothetical protein